jgi:hypothetical protein
MSEAVKQWEMPDEAKIRARHRRACLNQVVLAFVGVAFFCLFISALFGVPQSFLGQWWMKPPRYPNALEFFHEEGWMLHEGEVCQMTSPGVYCYEWYYRTDDSIEDIIAYYENLEWRFHPQIKFEWRRGRRFAQRNWVAEANVRILSNICGYQIIVHPSPDGDTEIYILERGAMGDYRASER